MIDVAVIGCGDVSRMHLDALAALDGVRLVGVCDTHSARRGIVAQKYGVVGYDRYRALFDEARPDAVHICTPHAQHAEIAIAALERGIHVVLEKPLAHDLASAHRIIAAAQESTARIGVCFQNRYNPPARAARDLLAGGELGAVRGAATTVLWHRAAEYYIDRPWRGRWADAGGGLLMNQAIHTLDLVQWLLGDVVSASGHVSTRALAGAIEVEDTAELALEHAGGARSVFYATLGHAVNAPTRIEIVTDNAVVELSSDLIVRHTDGRVETVAGAPASGARGYWGRSHELLIGDFYRSLTAADPFWIGPGEALKTLEIIQGVYDQTYPARSAGTPTNGEPHHG